MNRQQINFIRSEAPAEAVRTVLTALCKDPSTRTKTFSYFNKLQSLGWSDLGRICHHCELPFLEGVKTDTGCNHHAGRHSSKLVASGRLL